MSIQMVRVYFGGILLVAVFGLLVSSGGFVGTPWYFFAIMILSMIPLVMGILPKPEPGEVSKKDTGGPNAKE